MSAVLMLASYSWIGWGPFTTWTVLAVLLVVYYLMWSQSRNVRLVNALPGPDFLPFLGNFLDLNVDLDGASLC
jgi:cytochrome P450 family 4